MAQRPHAEAPAGEPRPRIGRRPGEGAGFARPPQPLPPSVWMLPDGSQADEDGVVGIGADLAPPTLVDAYRRGIFPWPHPGVPLPWFSPDPRGVLPLAGLHIPRRLRGRMRTCGWTATVDLAFEQVVAGCAERPHDVGTWITDELVRAYARLHRLGWAHSVEIWDGPHLIGGLYGVQIGGVFTGESMFHRETDASKVALAETVARLAEADAALLDVQLLTPHLERLGAVEFARTDFLDILEQERDRSCRLRTARQPVARLAEMSPRTPTPSRG